MRTALWLLMIPTLAGCAGQSSGTTAGAAFLPAAVQVAAGQPMTDANRHTVMMLDDHRGPSTRPGKQCVRVSVTVTNSDTADWLAPLNQMQLSDARGFVYYKSDDCGTNTTMQSLGPGQSASAVLYFEVLTNATIEFNWAPKIGDPGYSTPLR